jgi:hypothetical protein
MSLLTQALQDIDYWIENSKSWHAEWIRSFGVRPGLERDMIDLYAEEYDFRFSEEIYELYQWHDGDIRIGDNANPIFFVPLDCAVTHIVTGHFPYIPYMPLFIGDECYYVTPEASEGQKTSPIFGFDGYISGNKSRPRGDFYHNNYAPSVTCLMQAIAECAKNYDGISAMHMDGSSKDIYPENTYLCNRSILSPIYEKYGVIGGSSGLWR